MKNINFQIGMSALESVLEIVKNNSVNSIFLVIYPIIISTPWREPAPFEIMLRHSDQEKKVELKNQEITIQNIEKFFSTVNEKWGLGVASLVTVGDEKLHIPMMDFHCEASDDNLKRIKEFLFFIGQEEGAILASGRSFHYYGADLLNQNDWLNFLGDCLLFSDYAGKRYVAHSLKKGYCTLRISIKATHFCLPKIVAVL